LNLRINTNEEYKEISISYEIVKLFDDEKLLDDYIYSFRRITNYTNPIRHFNRKYSRLFDVEFDAIIEDNIYLKRTIVGTVLNAMHSHQRGFITYISGIEPELLIGGADLDKALEILWDYLKYAILEPANYLMKSAEILKLIVPDEFVEIGFGLEPHKLYKNNTQMIQPQVQIIEDHLQEFYNYYFEIFIVGKIQIQDDFRYKNLFYNSPLPIKIKPNDKN